MAVCAVLCRADNLSERFGRPLKGGTLSHDTFGDVFRVLDGRIFETRFWGWINGLAGLIEGVVAIDGKTLRGRGREEATSSCLWSRRTRCKAACAWPRKAARNLPVPRRFILATFRKEASSTMCLRRRRLHADRNPTTASLSSGWLSPARRKPNQFKLRKRLPWVEIDSR